MDLERHSWLYAVKMHGNQVRQYTGEPYVNQSVEVAAIVASVQHTPAMIAASYLQDTVKNTNATLDEIKFFFGDDVAQLVEMLNDVSKPEDGHPLVRKAIDLHHAAESSPPAQTIKIARVISDTISVVEHDPAFAKTDLIEKYKLLHLLKKGDRELWASAHELVVASMREIGIDQSIMDRALAGGMAG